MAEDLIKRYQPVRLKYFACTTNDTHRSIRPPIILLHGMFGGSSSWNRIKCELSNRTRRKVFSVDLRNHGESEYSDEFTLQHLTSDLLQFMRDQNIPRAILIGHSVAGRACIQLALLKPEMVEQLVVEDISISDVSDSKRIALKNLISNMQKVVSQLPVYMSLNDAHNMIQRLMQKHMVHFAANGETSALEKALLFKKNSSTGAFEFCFNVNVLLKSLDSIHLLRNDLSGDPVYLDKALFLSGQHSVIPLDEDRDLILKHFPRAQFAVVNKGYHCTHAESPTEFVRIVSDFLTSEEERL
ncbi:sn-1-specific diacylglycerol lipase ABHD11-like [Parasteatoda tepidariorum]|uniref:sn-1-specific diacylglycerol lipase ABHD11-like n=1 Tax=Parasteatoda tepidariorum TaxID=114398 RepID=UPI00077FC393|nr:protein ABHD11-like [Parasteatoda tepidariorum]